MIKHVVMWIVKEAGAAREIKDHFKEMELHTAGVDSVEVGMDINKSDMAYDVVLITTHKDREALDIYQSDPYHTGTIKPFVHERISSRRVVDFEY